jgi:hypothetical protein
MTDDIVDVLKSRLAMCRCATSTAEPCDGCRHDKRTMNEIVRLRNDLAVVTEQHRLACLDRDGYLDGNMMMLRALEEANESVKRHKAEIRRLEADHG